MPALLARRPWVAVLVVYLLSRVLSTGLLGSLFALATSQGWSFASNRADPTLFTFSGSWDASFYKTIAEQGYPTTLPKDDDGYVQSNPWAFLPVFPGIVKAIVAVTGLPFYTAGVLVATVFGFGAALMLYRLLALRVPRERALFAVAVFCVGPMGFLLQCAYAESAFLFFFFTALWCLMTRRYLLLIPFAVVAAFTRPGMLAFALTLGIHLVVRWRESRIRGGRLPVRDTLQIVFAGAVVTVAGLAWPWVATGVTGERDAYLDTELSWWVGYVGHQAFRPLTPWFTMAATWLSWPGVLLVLLTLAAGAFWLTRRSTRELGHEIVGFTTSYWLYLVAVFLPQQSLFRLMMPVAPLLGSRLFSETRRRRVVVLVVAVALQAVALIPLWFVGYP